MTNQQGAPEAPRPIARYKIGYATDDWGVRSSTPSGIPDSAGAWVLYKDHVAALVEAQQPAPSAAAAPDGWESVIHEIRSGLVDSEPSSYDNSGYRSFAGTVLDAVEDGLLKLVAPQSSTTPQADSVTAPAGGEVAVPRETLRAWRQWCAQSMSHAIEHEISDFLAATAQPAQAAYSVPKARFDDPKVQSVYAILCEDAEPPKGEHWEGFAARRIVDALSADSVLEDAARYQWLFGARTDAQTMSGSETVFKPLPQDEVLSHLQGFCMSKTVVDALVDAARKQGGAT